MHTLKPPTARQASIIYLPHVAHHAYSEAAHRPPGLSSSVSFELRPMMLAARLPKLIERIADASSWAEKNTLQRVAYPIEFLFIVARDLSIPLLDEPRWRRAVCGLSLLGAPQLLLFKFVKSPPAIGGALPLPLLVLLLTLPLSAAAYRALDDATPPTRRGISLSLLVVAFAASCAQVGGDSAMSAVVR